MKTAFTFDAVRSDGRPLVMGILNVTPDSFSDGGRFLHPDRACAQAAAMLEEGADIIDVGAESTRPGALPVPPAAQIARLLPVLTTLRARLGDTVLLSVDTRDAAVAKAALSAGARLVNDISAAGDPDMFEVVRTAGAGLVLMHMQGSPQTMQAAPHYVDVVGEVRDFLLGRARAAERAGIAGNALALDPGIGFGKTRTHNLRLLAALEAFVATGYPVLLGTSRKRFMGAICAETEPAALVGATCATTALGVAAGVRIVRVHDVKANRQAADVAWACRAAAAGELSS